MGNGHTCQKRGSGQKIVKPVAYDEIHEISLRFNIAGQPVVCSMSRSKCHRKVYQELHTFVDSPPISKKLKTKKSVFPTTIHQQIPQPHHNTGPKKFCDLRSAAGATVCFSRLELTLHGSPAVCLAADVVVLPLHTRHRHRQHAMTCLQHYP